VVNIKDTNYENKLNYGSKKISNVTGKDFEDIEKPIQKLQSLLQESTDLMEKKLIYSVIDIKQKLKSELDITKKLLETLKTFEK